MIDSQSAPETWLTVVGYEGIYEVSNLGSVRSVDRRDARGNHVPGRTRAPFVGNRGHLIVCLSRNGIERNVRIHRLVLEAFVGPCPPGMEACHFNDDPTDNRLSNLRWDTQSANTLDRVRNGRHNNARKTQCPQGHDYSGGNLIIRKCGKRVCRACETERNKRRRAQRQETAA